MGATQKPRAATPFTGAGQETPAELPAMTPDGAQDVTGATGTSATPSTDAQGAPGGEGGELGDDGSPKHPAEYFFKSNWYSHRHRELEKLLEEDKEYSYEQVERMLSRQ